MIAHQLLVLLHLLYDACNEIHANSRALALVSPTLKLDPEVGLEREPLTSCRPWFLRVDHINLKMPNELSDEFIHLNHGKVLPDAASTAHSELCQVSRYGQWAKHDGYIPWSEVLPAL